MAPPQYQHISCIINIQNTGACNLWALHSCSYIPMKLFLATFTKYNIKFGCSLLAFLHCQLLCFCSTKKTQKTTTIHAI